MAKPLKLVMVDTAFFEGELRVSLRRLGEFRTLDLSSAAARSRIRAELEMAERSLDAVEYSYKEAQGETVSAEQGEVGAEVPEIGGKNRRS